MRYEMCDNGIVSTLINLLCASTTRDESHFWLLCHFHQLLAAAVAMHTWSHGLFRVCVCESDVSVGDARHSFLMGVFMRK